MVKNPPANVGHTGSVPGSGRSLGVGNGNPLQSSCLENPTGGKPGRLQSMGSQKSQTGLVDLKTPTSAFIVLVVSCGI